MPSKEQKNNFICWFEEIICSKRLSSRSNVQLIRALHTTIWFFLIIMLTVGPWWMMWVATLFIIMATSAFIILNGCVLSMLENKLCQDGFNVFDPVLEYFNIHNTPLNLMKVTQCIGTIYLFIVLYIIYIRLS